MRCWTFPGSESDQWIIRTVRDDLGSWNLHRRWVADAGFASAANRAYLTRGGGHYIHAEKLRHTNAEAAAGLARPGRYRHVADNLRVKDVRVAPGGGRADVARAERFVVCHNPDAADRHAVVRGRLIEYLSGLIAGSDTWPTRKRDEVVGSLRNKPWLRRLLRRTKTGLLRIDRAAAAREAHYDGKWLLRTSDQTLTPYDLADFYKQLLAVERGAGATARAGLTQTNVSDQGGPSVGDPALSKQPGRLAQRTHAPRAGAGAVVGIGQHRRHPGRQPAHPDPTQGRSHRTGSLLAGQASGVAGSDVRQTRRSNGPRGARSSGL